MATAHDVTKALSALGNPEKAQNSSWFFKTGEGQYGYGDKFIGVTMPEQRIVAKRYRNLASDQIEKLLESPFHECRMTALLILCMQFRNGDEKTKKDIYAFYMSHLARINNWDLVDASSRLIPGEYLLTRNRIPLYTLAKSNVMWERRIAIVATHAFIIHEQFDDTLAIAEILLEDKEDIMHKAVGWMLREVGKRSRPTLVKFLERHAATMPRTTLRYSLEHFAPSLRAKYMKMKTA